MGDQFNMLDQQIEQSIAGVEGWLSRRETQFLTVAAASPTADGDVLEIGSFRGRSTIALALAMQSAARRTGSKSHLIAIDPMLDDDPLMQQPLAVGGARRAFEDNLRRAGIRNRVEFFQDYSFNVATTWQRPLRFLWIDGDHSYPSTKQDFDLFSPFLADGAILAMHDVLSRYDGCIRVFTEEVLTSSHFGAVGLCGSIGWAQYWKEPQQLPSLLAQKQQMLSKLRPLLPYHTRPESPRGFAKLRYKWLRSRVPHRAIDARSWQQLVHAA